MESAQQLINLAATHVRRATAFDREGQYEKAIREYDTSVGHFRAALRGAF